MTGPSDPAAPPLGFTGLPPSAYYDPAVAERERARIFARSWIFAGLAHDFAAENDFVTLAIAETPVVVQRTGGEVKAFRNVCSHRFAPLQCTAHGNRPLLCPYHFWRYDAEGVPVGVPDNAAAFGYSPEQKRTLALERFEVAACGMFVFVRLVPGGPGLEEQLGPEAEAFLLHLSAVFDRPFRQDRLHWRANWKIGVESVLEIYHVGPVHPQTFARFAMAPARNSVDGHSLLRSQPITPESGQMWATIRRWLKLDASDRLSGYNHVVIWPNLAIGVTDGSLVSIQTYEPEGPEQLALTYRLAFARSQRQGPAHEAMKAAVGTQVADFNAATLSEDQDISQRVQANLRAAPWPARLSGAEMHIAAFHDGWRHWMAAASLP